MPVDLYPVHVTVGDTRHERVRLIIDPADGTARIYGQADGNPVHLTSAAVDDIPDGRRLVTRVALTDGTVWTVDHLGGCRCGVLGRVTAAALRDVAIGAAAAR